MKPETILQSDYLDILFDERNKSYGAYVLRREYDRRMWIAMGTMLAMVLLFSGFYFWDRAVHPTLVTRMITLPPDLKIDKVEIKPDPLPQQKKAAQQVATIKNVVPRIVPNDQATDPTPPVEELNDDNKAIGAENREGVPPTGIASPQDGDGHGTTVPTAPAEEENSVYVKSELMPTFPGGNSALIRYLQKRLHFEYEGLQAGTRIEIRCRFVVDKEGKVTGIEIVKSGGQVVLDDEVLRVVRQMPQWAPGQQNGHPVNVYFTLPVVVEVPLDEGNP